MYIIKQVGRYLEKQYLQLHSFQLMTQMCLSGWCVTVISIVLKESHQHPIYSLLVVSAYTASLTGRRRTGNLFVSSSHHHRTAAVCVRGWSAGWQWLMIQHHSLSRFSPLLLSILSSPAVLQSAKGLRSRRKKATKCTICFLGAVNLSSSMLQIVQMTFWQTQSYSRWMPTQHRFPPLHALF